MLPLTFGLKESFVKNSGGFFGSGESTGSVGVVTINMPRIAYQAENEVDFYARLDHLMDLAARSLKTKRTVITKFLEAGLYPYTKRYLGTFDNHFSTIGLVGMNEACLNAKWLGKDLTQVEAQEFTKDVLNHMRERLSDYQEQYGDLYNLEATLQNLPPIVLLSMTRKRFRTSSLQTKTVRLTIRIVLICLLVIQRTSLVRLTYKMNFRRFTLPVRYFMHSWVKNYLIGRRQQC